MVTEPITIRRSSGMGQVSGEVHVAGGGTTDREVVVVLLVPNRYDEMDEAEESEALRRLSLNALEDEWDDDESGDIAEV